MHPHLKRRNERGTYVLHSNAGPVLLGLWYRPPAYGEVDSISSLDDEMRQNSDNVIGTVLVGDFNVHHKEWLRFSSGTTPEGRRLFQVCVEQHGLVQCVGSPTRGNHLLDLVLTNFPKQMSTEVLPSISDHKVVKCNMQLSFPLLNPAPRRVYLFHRAKWNELNNLGV